MNKNKFFSFLMAQVFVLAALLSAGCAPAQAQKPFGTKSDVAYGKDQLWKALLAANLVGEESTRPVPYKGTPPHGKFLETLFAEVEINGEERYVIVKMNYGGPGITRSKVVNERDKYLKWITVMVKRENGFDPAHKNWFWAKFAPNGQSFDKAPNGLQLVGKVKGCIACHSLADGGNYVYLRTAKYLDKK